TSASVAASLRQEAGGLVCDADVRTAIELMQQEFHGAGALEALLRSCAVTVVLVTSPDELWVNRDGGLERAAVRFPDEESVRRLAQRLAMICGRRLDDAQPWVDGWLTLDGVIGSVRMHAVLPPVAAVHTCISLRVLRPAAHSLDALQRRG